MTQKNNNELEALLNEIPVIISLLQQQSQMKSITGVIAEQKITRFIELYTNYKNSK